jgi:hypothetical protein
MRQVQPETLPKNSIFFPVYKISSLKINRKPISATYTRTKTNHKHRGICCLLSLVKTCLIRYRIILNLTTVNVPRIENIIFFNLQKKTVAFHCVWFFCSCVRCRNRLSVECDCIDRFRYFVIVLIKY